MRMAFGLVGILVTIGVIVWVMHMAYLPYVKTVVKTQQQVTPQIQQFGARDTTSGAEINTTYKLEPQESGGKVQSLLVTDIDPTSAMVSVYGLKRDDSIVAISWHGDMEKVKDINDAESAEDRLMEAYRGSEPIVVVRDGEEVTLTAKTPPPALAVEGNSGSAQPKNNAAGGKDSMQQQLDAIQQIPGN